MYRVAMKKFNWFNWFYYIIILLRVSELASLIYLMRLSLTPYYLKPRAYNHNR